MSATVKMFSRKGIHIETSFRAERNSDLVFLLCEESREFYSFYRERIIHHTFCIAFLKIIFFQIACGKRNERSIVFLKHFHFFYQTMSEKANSVFRICIKNLLVC